MLAYPEHHSPSSINQWRNSPAIYCLRYLYKGEWIDDAAPGMWRGTAVERGFEAYLRGTTPEDALAIALDHYQQEIDKWTNLKNSGS